MGSKGRMPPPHMRRSHPGPGLLHPDPFGLDLRRSHPGPGMLHPDPFGPDMRPLPGNFPFDMLPPPEIMEQKLDAQQVEMQRLATENQRIAATHSILRQELAAAQQELQRLQSHMGALKADQEQQMRVVLDKIAKMEADLQASEPIKMELQQARGEAQNLMAARHELFSKVQQLNQDLHRSHGDSQQIPALMSELDSLRQEYHHCRATFDYERKLRVDHSEQLQVMEKNYVSMVREVEALRSELSKASSVDKTGAVYASNAGYKEGDAPVHQSTGQNVYEDAYGVPQGGRGPPSGVTNYGGDPAGPAAVRAGYDAHRGPAYDGSRNPSHDAPRAAGAYDAPRAGSYEAPPRGGGAGYDAPPRGGPGYDAPPPRGGPGVTQPAMVAGNSSVPYGSAQMAAPYGSAQPAAYGSVQPAPYGSAQAPPAYGSSQAPSAYGSSQAPPPGAYRTSQPTPTRAAGSGGAGGVGGGGYEAPPHGGNAPRRQT